VRRALGPACDDPGMRDVRAPTPGQLAAAETTIRSVLTPTPVVAAPQLGEDVWLKLEMLQPTGSFKVRGGLAAMADLGDRRVVVASAGNHGLGVAWAARLYGRRATVVVPEDASPAKVARLERLPVELLQAGRGYDGAEAAALELAAEGATYVSPYNDPRVIAGQRTVGLELDTQLDRPLSVVVPVGGGGLLAGLSLWARERGDVRLIGVEAAASTAFSAALDAGGVVDVAIGETIADGITGGLEPGSITVDIVRAGGQTTMVTVTEDALLDAIAYLHREHGLVVEGAGAAGVAAVRARELSGTVVVLVTGRNVTDSVLGRALSR
jgi:threonine dehydratase